VTASVAEDGDTDEQTDASGDRDATALGRLRTAARADMARLRRRNLHWLVFLALAVPLIAGAAVLAVFADVFASRSTLSDFVALLAVNAAWFYTGVFALAGLFVAYPGHGGTDGRARLRDSPAELLGVLLSRWLLVGGSVAVGFALVLALALATYEPFSIPAFLAVAVLTMLSVSGYVSAGVAAAALARSTERFVGALLGVYATVLFLWDSALLPVAISVAVTGDAEGTIGTPPAVHDNLLALSPGGAHAGLVEAALGHTGVSAVAVLALVAWLVAPPIVALARTR
jgi:hypothetical protein